jgi:hypothetical protein
MNRLAHQNLPMNSVILFQLENETIKITIEAYFDAAGNLVVEGYDIGKTVKEYWGDIDYEYSVTVYAGEVKKLYSLLQVNENDSVGLLNRLRDQYHSNTCFSEIRELLEKNNIQSVGFSWI